MAKLFTRLTILIIVVAVGLALYQKYSSDGLTYRAAEYGKENEIKIDRSSIKREEFKIKYDQAEWNILQAKLNLTRYFNRLENVPDFSFGFNPEYAKDLVTYWSKSFDWKKQINRLNKYQQYRITINNTIVHYIYHETNKGKQVKQTINLMLIDGWPGCSFSFHKMIEKIENEYKDVSFKIIVPSIPGYGYSTPLNHVVDLVDTSILFDAIMRYENAEEYFVHGEDWGCAVTNLLAQLFPNRVRGIHITFPHPSNEFTSLIDLANYVFGIIVPTTYYTEKEIELKFPERYTISNRLYAFWSAFGYFHLQATKPDTVAHGITDSPVGLLAYVLEKYSSWTLNYEKQIVGKRDGGLGKFDKDDLLSIITIYWMTNSIGSSVRYYKINLGGIVTGIKNDIQSAKISPQVRVGVQLMDNELLVVPESAARIRYPNLVQYNIIHDAGHFAAFEKPLETAKNFGQFVLNSF